MSEQDLVLPFEDEPDTRRSRRRQKEKRKRDRRRAVTALVLVLMIFVLLAGGVWYGIDRVGSLLAAPDYSGGGSGQVVVQIKDGDTASAIADTLQAKGVVKSTKAFVEAATAEPRSLGLQPGSYTLRREMKASEALAMLLDPASRLSMRFTVTEGQTVATMFEGIEKQTKVSVASLRAAAKQPAVLGLPAWAKGDLEGFLFPDTYSLDPGTDAVGILKEMVARTLKELDAVDFVAQAQAVNLDPLEALTVASLLEGEGKPEDFGKVARVVYNRLKAKMPLQFDSTTIYGRELRGLPRVPTEAGGLFKALRDPADPYSTYSHPTLPPTPISNPGRKALEAAVAPERGPWLYFVVVGADGKMAFTDDLAVHEQNIAKCQAVGKCN